jgi:deazaflavin-dependent oxidoreductase (nitroreductase family)
MAALQSLPYVDPRTPRGPLYRLFVWFISTGFMTWLARTRPWGAVIWRIDPLLMRLTRGRLRTGLLLPTALLETRGARTGRLRRNAVVYFHDGERVTIIASQAGRRENPSWFYNARANRDVMLAGRPFHVEVIEDEAERTRLWELADRVLPAFARYRDTAGHAGRTIPILQLVPRARQTVRTNPPR